VGEPSSGSPAEEGEHPVGDRRLRKGEVVADIADVDQDYKLWVLLHQTSGMIFEARENAVREYDITTMQAEVLFAIQAIGGEATPTQVSR